MIFSPFHRGPNVVLKDLKVWCNTFFLKRSSKFSQNVFLANGPFNKDIKKHRKILHKTVLIIF